MTAQNFSKKEAIGFGWNAMKSNLGFFIGLLMVVFVINIVLGFASDTEIIAKFIDNFILAIIIAGIATIIGMIISMTMEMGLIRIVLRFCDNEKGKFADLFSCFSLFFKYLFTSIIYGLIVFGGIILLIVPGIIWGIKFQFFGYFIVDKRLGPIEALKRSSAITKGVKWNLFLFSLLLIFINLLGALCLLIGLFATIPTTMIAYAFVYRKLLSQTEAQVEAQTENLQASETLSL